MLWVREIHFKRRERKFNLENAAAQKKAQSQRVDLNLGEVEILL